MCFDVMTPEEFFELHGPAVEALCARAVRGTRDTRDEALSECWERLPGALATYDSRKGASLKTHVLTVLRWYIFKMTTSGPAVHQRRAEKLRRAVELSAPTRLTEDPPVELDASSQVNYILAGLNEDQRTMLVLRYIEGWSLKDVADYFEIGHTAASQRIREALEAARETGRGTPEAGSH